MAKLKTVFGEVDVLSVYENKMGYFAKSKGILPRSITKEEYEQLKAEIEAENEAKIEAVAEPEKKGEPEEVGEPTEEEVSETESETPEEK